MAMWKCANCSRRFDDDSAYREGYHFGDAGEPGYAIDACFICAPNADDIERALNDKAESSISEAREGAAPGPDGHP